MRVPGPTANASAGLSDPGDEAAIFVAGVCHTFGHVDGMASAVAKKITANLPAKLLAQAQRITGNGITETLIAGLEQLERAEKRGALRRLRGQVHFELDLDETRR